MSQRVKKAVPSGNILVVLNNKYLIITNNKIHHVQEHVSCIRCFLLSFMLFLPNKLQIFYFSFLALFVVVACVCGSSLRKVKTRNRREQESPVPRRAGRQAGEGCAQTQPLVTTHQGGAPGRRTGGGGYGLAGAFPPLLESTCLQSTRPRAW